MASRAPNASTGRSLWERQRDAIRQAKAAANTTAPPPRYTFPPAAPPAPEPQPARGTYRVEQLRLGQCRYACTPDDAPRGAHRFCGAPTEIGRGNPHGSWCPEHLPMVHEKSSRLAQPAFLKNVTRSPGR